MNPLIIRLAAVLLLTAPVPLIAQTSPESASAPAVSQPPSADPASTTELERLKADLQRHMEEEKNRPAPAPVLPLRYTLTGQLRHRAELDGRSFTPEARSLGYQLLRSRVNLTIEPMPETKVFLQLQDSRIFGAGSAALNRGTQDGMSKAIDFHQAYFSLQQLFGAPLRVQVGRQELQYGNQRLMGVSSWGNIGTTFDAVVVQWKEPLFSVDLFRSKLVGTQTTTASENLTGLYGTYKYSTAHSADAALIMDNNTAVVAKGADKGESRLNRLTAGVMLSGKMLPFEYDLDMAVQYGSIAVTDSALLTDIRASFAAVRIGMLLSAEHAAKVSARYQLLSGDPDQRSGEYTTFNTLFASAHGYYGFMDFFPKTLNEYGLHAVSLHGSIDIVPSTAVMADMYWYRTDAGLRVTGTTGQVTTIDALGYELDLTVLHKYSSAVSVNAGVSAFVPEEAMRRTKGPAVSYWSFLMTTVNF
ncbi:MAG: alginate export family protein [Bacteroidetes bacterium]|nr:alginate export family protein [Bacteroidota bacterium]